ncbi:hypothetical protein SPRG_19310 [Saprolegnia parasitica CBS 223.65]|uniref:LamG-like jellyroll fold domain-containing protein n=1 Tax=Saprolegnia parasitica (strain CBS 223.65) TaxID=695850 RepID=A0A067D4U6_SAPPC|nr:hypothetical protein SPRG_19310 [Saprolegnia parasitica CBS 223.65]KDO33701.1 hypothetical protein SPRG_19310 [Saprolegnia parasitica CBS 223.65]|eukprot:XP_012195722.1 hypothetical protein SPRG_19310 [Saprolegnia parasitica CBS 223.65]
MVPASSFVLKEKIADVFLDRAHELEIVVYHPARESLILVATASLYEVDLRTGCVLGAIPFDSCLLNEKPNVFDDVVPAGQHHVIATLSRYTPLCRTLLTATRSYLVVWDLREMTLCCITEVLKSSLKSPIVVTAATTVPATVFFGHEGSQSIKVTTVEGLCSGEACQKIPRKVVSRNSVLCALAYDARHNLLASGGTDGIVHVWRAGNSVHGATDDECSKDEHTKGNGDDISPHALLATFSAKSSPVQALAFNGQGLLAAAYLAGHLDIFDVLRREPGAVASPTTAVPTGLSLYGRHSIHFSASLNTLVLLLLGASQDLLLHRMHFGDSIDSSFGGAYDINAHVAAVVPCDSLLALYTSSPTARSLALLEGADDDIALSNIVLPPTRTWSMQPQFSFLQYCSPDDVPRRLLHITTGDDLKFGLSALDLQTNEKTEICPLLATFEGLPLQPLRLAMSRDGSTAAVFLSSSQATVMTLIDVNAPTAAPTYEVRDVCFTPTHLVSLMPSGRSVRVHGNWKAKEPDGLLLNLPTTAARVFPTRWALPNSEACKVLFVVQDALGRECLRLSEHTVAFTLDSSSVWSAEQHEPILEVQNEPEKASHLIAVRTSKRLVVLDKSLQVVATFAPRRTQLQETPTSMLWVGDALAFATIGATLRYWHPASPSATHALCSVPVTPPGSQLRLTAFLPDRVLYMVLQDDAKAATMYTRPFAPLEVLVCTHCDKENVQRYIARLLEYGPPLVQVSWKTLSHLNNPALSLRLLNDGKKAKAGAMYRETSHIAANTLAAIFLAAHRWRDAATFLVSDDPALYEYALNPQGAEAQLPPKLSHVAAALTRMAATLQSMGQLQLAAQCLDVAGNDAALLSLVRSTSLDENTKKYVSYVVETILHGLKTAHPTVVAAVTASDAKKIPKHVKMDVFRLLCTERLVLERRSRLVASLSGLRHVRLPPSKTPLLAAPDGWKYFTWKRLEPEDVVDWVGSSTPHFSTQEFVKKSLQIDVSDSFGEMRSTPMASAPSFGPFLDDEDSVMAYWRFEDAATLSPSRTTDATLLDTSKRENHLIVAPAIVLDVSTAPVDKGEESKLLPAYMLHFPAIAPLDGSDWHASCATRKGGSMDFGTSFDEDPYRRHLTFECWVRYHAEGPLAGSSSNLAVLAARSPLWAISAESSGRLCVQVHDRSLPTDGSLQLNGSWQHVALVLDIVSDDKASVRVLLDGASVLAKEIAVKMTESSSAALQVGPRLLGFDMTEIRLWATSRSVEQINDMKENYLGIAETKKRIKVAIHQRDCQCEKCIGRRQNTPLAKLAMVQPLAASPVSRARRVIKTPQSPVASPKREETRLN